MFLLIRLLLALTTPILLIIGAIFLINTLLMIDDLKACPDGPQAGSGQCEKADAIVAISGGDTPARAQEAIALYQMGWADKLLFSGAAEDTSGPSNAEAMRLQALKAGVPVDAITLDEYALDTAGNAADLKNITQQQKLRHIILVTSPYHQRRASLEFQKALGSSVAIVNHPASNDRDWSPDHWWLSARSWWLAGSELVKIAFIKLSGL